VLAWDESDVLTCLETISEIEPDGVCYHYKVEKGGTKLDLARISHDRINKNG